MSVVTEYIDGLVSVIVPVYNAEVFLKDTIESAINQSYKNLEIILVDDMSTDDSRKVIKYYEEKYENVKSIFLEKNSGVAKARNIGIKNSKGRYIAFLDSDDVWDKDKIKKQVEFMKVNNYYFTFTGYRFIDENGEKLKTVVEAVDNVDYKKLLRHNVIACLTVVIDRYKISDIFMPDIRHEDYVTWLSILKKDNKAYGLKEELAYYRVRGNSLSGNKIKAASWTWNILRNIEKLPLHKAVYYFCIYAIVNIKKHIF